MLKFAILLHIAALLPAAPAAGAVLDELTLPRREPVFFRIAISPNGRDLIVPYRVGEHESPDYLKCYVRIKSGGTVSDFYAGYDVDEARFYGRGKYAGNYLVKYCPYRNREKNYHWYIINGKVLGEFRNSLAVHNDSGSSFAVAYEKKSLFGSSWRIRHDEKEYGPFDEVTELKMSPDGSRVISISSTDGTKNAVYINGKAFLKHGREKFDTPHNLAISPDSKGFAFVHYDQGGSYIHYNDGTESRELGPYQSAYCMFMPSGKPVFYYQRNNLRYFEKYPDQKVYGPYERVNRIPLLAGEKIFGFAFEKEHRHFVFIEKDGRQTVFGPHAEVENLWLYPHNRHLFIYGEAGRDQQERAIKSYVNIDGKVFGAEEGGYDFVYQRVFEHPGWRPLFSPDGSRFAFRYQLRNRLYLNLGGSAIELPGDIYHMEFSPDSRILLLYHNTRETSNAYSVFGGSGASAWRKALGDGKLIHTHVFTEDSRLLYAYWDWRKSMVMLEEMDTRQRK